MTAKTKQKGVSLRKTVKKTCVTSHIDWIQTNQATHFVACEQALSLWVLREIYFGRKPQEDWGGGELGRACRHD